MNFKEPISTFAYNLISLHHDIMWYIIIIISLVYWSLYKIIKEYSWNNFNKQEGFLLIAYSGQLFKLQSLIIFIWFNIFSWILKLFIYCFLKLAEILDDFLLKNNKYWSSKLSFFLGKNYYKGFYNNTYLKNFSFSFFENVIIERYIAYYLFQKSSNASYFYDGYDNILDTLSFKHSINLEYIFGLFPTVIIGFIIVPSMYLLYSNETDINPALTIKIMGHQWYWSYESSSVNFLNDSNKVLFLDYNFDSVIISDNDLIKGTKRLLETDNSLVLPYNVIIRFLILLQMFYMHELFQN